MSQTEVKCRQCGQPLLNTERGQVTFDGMTYDAAEIVARLRASGPLEDWAVGLPDAIACGGCGGRGFELVEAAPDGPATAIEVDGEAGPSNAVGAPAESVFSLQANPGFPTVTPAVLRLPEAKLRLRAALIGVGLGVVTSVLIFLFTRKGSLLSQMFDLRHFSTLIPISISCLFFWGLLLCGWRWRRVGALERLSTESLLLDATRVLSASGLSGLAEQMEGEKSAVSPLLRRLQAVVGQWQLRPGLQDAEVVLQQHIAHDAEAVQAAYGLVRTFVWALPVLGLIGTVVGISLAVGGFAQFLAGNIDDVAIVKQNLVGVTGGLSFAFLITLQGLVTSLLLMLASSALQTREEKLYAGMQQAISDHFLPALQRVAPEAKAGFEASDVAAWRAALVGVTQEVAEATRERSRDLLREIAAAMDARQQAHAEQVAAWNRAWHGDLEAGARQLGEAAGRLGAELSGASDTFLERLADVRGTLNQQAARLAEILAAEARAASERQAAAASLAAEQNRALQATAAALAQLTETTRAALAGQAALHNSLEHLSGARLPEAFDRVTAAIREQSAKLEATAGALAGLARLTEGVLASQGTLHLATQQLREADFTGTLAAFRDSLGALAPVLASFREPFVLQAVPVMSRAQTAE